ncbi:MAG: hypothetical protein IID44_12295 [Planctomycetes bacterium]|nr:hypothetical protein [Planctomycetota bacterium]
MKRCQGLASLILLGLIASAACAEPPTSGPKLGAQIVPLKRGPVSGPQVGEKVDSWLFNFGGEKCGGAKDGYPVGTKLPYY